MGRGWGGAVKAESGMAVAKGLSLSTNECSTRGELFLTKSQDLEQLVNYSSIF